MSFDVAKFKKDYNTGNICLSGDKFRVVTLIEELGLDWSDWYEEKIYLGVGYSNLYIANRNTFSKSFSELIAIRQVSVDELTKFYPPIKVCHCCGQAIKGC